jgi:translation initiation factor IF-3
VRVIGSDGEPLGVMPTDKAQALADEQGLDLVEVSPTASPPVCRIVDFGKFKYERNKRLKQARKKQHTIHVKEVKFRPKTEEHDYQFKKRHAEDFLSRSYKVKFTVVFRGRELDHKEMGGRILERIKKDLAHLGVVERPAQFEGRLMTMFMAPLPGKQPAKRAEPATVEDGQGEAQDAET